MSFFEKEPRGLGVGFVFLLRKRSRHRFREQGKTHPVFQIVPPNIAAAAKESS